MSPVSSTIEQLHLLRERGADLARVLKVEADRLEQDATPPTPALLLTLSQFIERHEQYQCALTTAQAAVDQAAAVQAAADQAAAVQAAADQAAAVAAEQAAIARAAIMQRENSLPSVAMPSARAVESLAPAPTISVDQRVTALEHLEAFLQLSSRDNATLLAEQQHVAREVQSRLFEDSVELPLDTELELLSVGQHRWVYLTRLVREGNKLSDADWVHLTGLIREAFAPELVSAALRGRLRFGAVVLPPELEVPAVVPPPVIPVVLTVPSHKGQPDTTLAADSRGSIFDDTPSTGAASASTKGLAVSAGPVQNVAHEVALNALFELSDEDDADSGILKQAKRFDDPQGESAELAKEILRGDLFTRGQVLPDLILALIFEGRSGFAYHLARSLEQQRQPTRPYLASWMIRAWSLGNVIMFPQGQLVGTLQEDFAQHDSEALQNLSAERRVALELFLRAVALRPAIVAPASRAAVIVRSFPMSADQPQLYNYCARVGNYGEKLQGLSPASFKRTDPAQNEVLQEELQQDVQKWLNESESYSVRYALTNPLFTRAHWSLRASPARRFPSEMQTWQRWQETVQTAHRIVRNVVLNRESAVAETRAEMERVAALVAQDRRSPLVVNNNDMRNYLLQAVTFGQRWVSLLGGSADTFVPQELQELRAEIESRHDGVIEELTALSDRYSSTEFRAAVGCLMLAMNQVRSLVDPDAPAESAEPDARHLLHADLLRIEGLQFSPNWLPQCDSETLIDSILQFLSGPQPTWTTAIQLQLAADNLDAAEKISTLPVFDRPQRRQLQQVLAKYRKQRQQELWKDLQATESLIEEASRMQIFSEQDRAGFAARLERLRRGLSLSRDHGAEMEELQRLRQAVERRRAREAVRTKERLEQLQGSTTPLPTKPAAPTSDWKLDFSGD